MIARLLAAVGLALFGVGLGLVIPVLWTFSALLGPWWVPDPRHSLAGSLAALVAPVWGAVVGWRMGWDLLSPEERRLSRERKERQRERLRQRQQEPQQ